MLHLNMLGHYEGVDVKLGSKNIFHGLVYKF